MPRALRDEVRLVGNALGQVIAEHGGEGLLADVEALRRTVIQARAEAAREADMRTAPSARVVMVA